MEIGRATFIVLLVALVPTALASGRYGGAKGGGRTGSQQGSQQSAQPEEGLLQVPKDVDHRVFDQLLKKYVDDKGLVNYAAWKKSQQDMAALRGYVDQFAKGKEFATGNERAASLINAYNAVTLRWILDNYPVESIWETDEPFKGKRHLIGGQAVSLDDIEHRTLRPLVGYRVHATLVCAARSCPPLRREAFRSDILDKQLDEQMRVWFARDDLNHFDPQKREAKVSSIFKFFKEDFGKEGGLQTILAKYAPAEDQQFLQSGKVQIDYLPYHWGLNDQSGRGKDYKRGLLKKIFR